MYFSEINSEREVMAVVAVVVVVTCLFVYLFTSKAGDAERKKD